MREAAVNKKVKCVALIGRLAPGKTHSLSSIKERHGSLWERAAVSSYDMHESWPLKLLPTSQQTFNWIQTTPREKNNIAFSPTHTHNFKCSDFADFPVRRGRSFILQQQSFKNLFWHVHRTRGEHHFVFPAGGRRACPVSPPGIGIWQQAEHHIDHFWSHSVFNLGWSPFCCSSK